MRARIGAVFAALAALLLVAANARADPAKIRIGWVGVPNSWAPMLEAKKDLARHSGKSYVLDLIRFKGTGEEIAALATGDLDIATLAFSAIAAAVQNAGLEDLRVILDEKQDGVPGTYSNEFMVLKSGPVTKAEDLKGKVIATNAIGGGFTIVEEALARLGPRK
jgi:sulfonate transport system substrate-binding protein